MNPIKTNYEAIQLHPPQKQIPSMKKLQIMKRFLLSTALLATLANTAQDGVTITLHDNGDSTISVTATGSLDTRAMTYNAPYLPPFTQYLNPAGGTVGLISNPTPQSDYYSTSIVGNAWAMFGSGGYNGLTLTSLSGTSLGLYLTGGFVIESGYVSGTPINTSGVYQNASFGSLGIDVGSSTTTFTDVINKTTTDFVTVNRTAAVPEPSGMGLLALGAGGLLARRRRAMAA
jgi:hypothetical protein